MTKTQLKQIIKEILSEVDWREHPAMADLYAVAHPTSKYNVPPVEPSKSKVGLFNKQTPEVEKLKGAEVIRADKDPSSGEITLQLVGKDGKTTYTAVLK